jgi:Uri superfamily endonuclease
MQNSAKRETEIEREREREWSERLKIATRNVVSFGCVDEENSRKLKYVSDY